MNKKLKLCLCAMLIASQTHTTTYWDHIQLAALRVYAQIKKLGDVYGSETIQADSEGYNVSRTIQIHSHSPEALFHAIITQHVLNPADKTPLCEIVDHIIELLERKKSTLSNNEQQACNKIIVLLKQNRNSKDLGTWSTIIDNKSFMQLLPAETQKYINESSEIELGLKLMDRLQS